jgi:hypothetical protein
MPSCAASTLVRYEFRLSYATEYVLNALIMR